MSKTILKFGWEFPPHHFGGLGIACEGLVYGLTRKGVRVLLVLPHYQESGIERCTITTPGGKVLLRVKPVPSVLMPYLDPRTELDIATKCHDQRYFQLYGHTLFTEIERYANAAHELVKNEQFDLIHAHDWMSFKAGVIAKKVSGKPLVVHVHATEFDRTGGHNIHPHVYHIEKNGMEVADKIVAVSEFTKQMIVDKYTIDPKKIWVIHNATPLPRHYEKESSNVITKRGPLVLFLGRLTLQKGPDYFVAAAQKVMEMRKDIMFVMAGSGDMEHRLKQQVHDVGLDHHVMFPGFVRGADLHQLYELADVYVMPSVSEPFGLTALEALSHGTPTILAKNAGVSEVVTHCLKVDFWDVNELANKILAVLEYQELKQALSENGKNESGYLNWDDAAGKCLSLYNTIC